MAQIHSMTMSPQLIKENRQSIIDLRKVEKEISRTPNVSLRAVAKTIKSCHDLQLHSLVCTIFGHFLPSYSPLTALLLLILIGKVTSFTCFPFFKSRSASLTPFTDLNEATLQQFFWPDYLCMDCFWICEFGLLDIISCLFLWITTKHLCQLSSLRISSSRCTHLNSPKDSSSHHASLFFFCFHFISFPTAQPAIIRESNPLLLKYDSAYPWAQLTVFCVQAVEIFTITIPTCTLTPVPAHYFSSTLFI